MTEPTPKNPLHSPLDVDAQPLETFIETVTTGGAGSLFGCDWGILSVDPLWERMRTLIPG